jgi:hypothetical protein
MQSLQRCVRVTIKTWKMVDEAEAKTKKEKK